MTSKYGTPYFSNYINSDMEPSDVRSMCCRLRLDLRELRKKTGGFFGSGESTGSVGVVTINMPRIAYLSATKDDFYKRLNKMMDIAARSLKIKREVITKLLNEGLYPYTKRYLGTFENHFSTIGLIGMNEVGLNANWLRADMTDKRTQEFTKEVLNHMRNRLSDYQEQYGDLYNLEATPAESTTYRLAKHDRKRWPAIKTAGKPGDTPYYTNSSHLPVDYTTDIFDAVCEFINVSNGLFASELSEKEKELELEPVFAYQDQTIEGDFHILPVYIEDHRINLVIADNDQVKLGDTPYHFASNEKQVYDIPTDSRGSVLVVDDSRMSRMIMKNLLEEEGYSVIGEATNGEEAIEMFKQHPADLTTLDITMPKMDGIEALQKILEIDPNAKVIMITAAGQQSKVLDALKYGAKQFITKPFEKDAVINSVKEILGK